MKKGFRKLQWYWEENPEQVIMLGIGVMTSSALLINAVANARGKSVWRKEVNRRDRMTPKYTRYPYSRR